MLAQLHLLIMEQWIIYTAYVHVQAKMNVCVIFTASANASYYLKYCYMFNYGASQIFYVYCIILN